MSHASKFEDQPGATVLMDALLHQGWLIISDVFLEGKVSFSLWLLD